MNLFCKFNLLGVVVYKVLKYVKLMVVKFLYLYGKIG